MQDTVVKAKHRGSLAEQIIVSQRIGIARTGGARQACVEQELAGKVSEGKGQPGMEKRYV